jgi:hypothetical protein
LVVLSGAFAVIPAAFSLASANAKKIVVGLNIPLTGAYSEQGNDEKRAYLLAID